MFEKNTHLEPFEDGEEAELEPEGVETGSEKAEFDLGKIRVKYLMLNDMRVVPAIGPDGGPLTAMDILRMNGMLADKGQESVGGDAASASYGWTVH